MSASTQDLNVLYELDAHQIRRRWLQVFRSEPPAGMSRDLQVRAIAFQLQARVQGGLSAATRRRLRTWAHRTDDGRSKTGDAIELKPGVRLIREWGARTHQVTVLEEGFEFDGKCYRSLTEVARVITGSHWSGPRFFGLRRRTGSRFKAEASADE